MSNKSTRPLTQPSWMVKARLVRRFYRRIRQQLRYHRFTMQGLPILFANSIPKSGTHLLTQILQAFQDLGPAVESGLPAVVMYQGDSGLERPEEEIIADLRRFAPGDIGYGHLHHRPRASEILTSTSFATYFILRDPRDIAVSHVHYVTELEPRHAHHHYFAHQLTNFEERLTATILGVTQATPPLPPLSVRLDPFWGWLEETNVLIIRYEELLMNRQAELTRILRHAIERGFQVDLPLDKAIAVIEGRIRPERSPTFRKGSVGGWREVFSPYHKQIFKEYCQGIVEALGYEKDENW